MGFKDFIQNETRFKGFKRQFLANNPNLPTAVANDLYNSRVGYSLRQALGDKTGEAETRDFASVNTASSILSDPERGDFKNLRWTPQPIVVNLCPLNFDEDTLTAFMVRRFGYKAMTKIRNDMARTETQRELMGQPGTNEPIILIKDGDKYKLLEGWHRTMSYLVFEPDPKIGAPPDQIAWLKRGDTMHINFTRWKPVPIKAYVGERLAMSV